MIHLKNSNDTCQKSKMSKIPFKNTKIKVEMIHNK